MADYELIKAWSKQMIDEEDRQDREFHELPIQAQEDALLTIRLYNEIFETSHNVNDWIWEYNPITEKVTRKYLYTH